MKTKKECELTKNTLKEIVVLKFTQTSLSTLRCLKKIKKKNVIIWSIGDKGTEYPAFYSFIANKKIILLENEGIVDCLLRIKDQFSSRPKILITSDKDVIEISDRREELQKFYDFILPPKDVLEILIEKAKFAKLAIKKNWNIPLSFQVQDVSELKKIKQELNFPFIVKPYLLHATKINDEKELQKLIKILKPIHFKSMIVQEWIDGDDNQIYYSFLLFDKESNPVASYVAQKLRQWPPGYGTTSLSVSINNDELLRESIEMFKELHMIGYCSIEYKLDNKSGKYYILEPTVGRFNQQIAATMASEVNFPEKLIAILDNQLVKYDKQINNIYWINEINDYLSYKKIKSKEYGYWRNYLKKNIKVFFNWKDPFPFFAELFSVIKNK